MKNKITFLLLHLGYGGIETATINTANALCNSYDIELVSLYNLKKNQEHEIKKNVKIVHLLDDEPNRREFIEAVKNLNILKTLKEGFKAIKILILKKILIKKYIKKSDSKVIISTRYDFSAQLSKYKKVGCIAIAQEHHHHNNNKKYIKLLSHKYKNIDYLLALTNNLKKNYEFFLKNNNKTKIMVMPNMIFLPNERVELNNKNVISVGRLHKGKCVNELVDIVNKTSIINKFYIIGDGDEYHNLQNQIKELELNKKVELVGYKNKSEIKNYFKNSSLFLMASVSEGLPMVLLEAMSYGIPCIAYENDSGVSDIIDNNKNGFIINNRNEEEFCSKIEKLLSDTKLLKSFSNESIKKSKEFSKDIIVLKWKKLLDNCFSKQ